MIRYAGLSRVGKDLRKRGAEMPVIPGGKLVRCSRASHFLAHLLLHNYAVTVWMVPSFEGGIIKAPYTDDVLP